MALCIFLHVGYPAGAHRVKKSQTTPQHAARIGGRPHGVSDNRTMILLCPRRCFLASRRGVGRTRLAVPKDRGNSMRSTRESYEIPVSGMILDEKQRVFFLQHTVRPDSHD